MNKLEAVEAKGPPVQSSADNPSLEYEMTIEETGPDGLALIDGKPISNRILGGPFITLRPIQHTQIEDQSS